MYILSGLPVGFVFFLFNFVLLVSCCAVPIHNSKRRIQWIEKDLQTKEYYIYPCCCCCCWHWKHVSNRIRQNKIKMVMKHKRVSRCVYLLLAQSGFSILLLLLLLLCVYENISHMDCVSVCAWLCVCL